MTNRKWITVDGQSAESVKWVTFFDTASVMLPLLSEAVACSRLSQHFERAKRLGSGLVPFWPLLPPSPVNPVFTPHTLRGANTYPKHSSNQTTLMEGALHKGSCSAPYGSSHIATRQWTTLASVDPRMGPVTKAEMKNFETGSEIKSRHTVK